MFSPALWPIVLGAFAVLATAKPTRTSAKRANDGKIEFVTTENGGFKVNGAPLKFVGTNAYWLHTLNNEKDIDRTLESIAASGIKVVRTWAFNDVTEVPENGVWFQKINNGTVELNEGENGLQRLDTVVRLAEKHGIYLLLALTNNWNPTGSEDITTGAGPVRRTDIVVRNNEKLPRNYLSNDYGGMDTYVRQFGLKSHDEFYTDPQVQKAFRNYTTTLAKRYSKSPAIFGWELANDPRCNSTVKATKCNPQVITKWHHEVAQEVKKADPNHLVSTGNGGGLCVGCPKLFPRVPPPPPPPPQVSPAPGQNNLRRRKIIPGFLTKERILRDRAALFKRNRLLKRGSKKEARSADGIQIRGRWTSSVLAKRQDQELGSAFDGSYGVDNEDILNIPEIDVGSFQLFPDQDQYGPDDPSLSPFENLVERGSEWIKLHAENAIKFGKPTTLNGFGLVTQNHAPNFVPFNTTTAPFGSDSGSNAPPPQDASYGVTTDERNAAFTEWFNVGLLNGLTSMIHYQWGQDGLSVAPGTTVSQASPGTGTTPEQGETGVSPNDGYAENSVEQGDGGVLDVLEQAVQNITSPATRR